MAQQRNISFVRGEHYSFDFHMVRGSSAFVAEAAAGTPTFGVGAPAGAGAAGQYYFDVDGGTGYRHDGSDWQALGADDARLQDFTDYEPKMQVRKSANADKVFIDMVREGFTYKNGDYTIKVFIPDDRSARLAEFSGVYDLWLEDEVDTSRSYLVLQGQFVVEPRVTRF